MDPKVLVFLCEASGEIGHGEAAAAVRKLTFVSGIHTILFTVLACFFLRWRLDISLQEKKPYCCSIMCVLCASGWCVLDVYVILRPCKWHMRQRDKTVHTERRRRLSRDHSPPLTTFLLAHHCHIASHDC